MSSLHTWARVVLYGGTISPLLVLQGIVEITSHPQLAAALIVGGLALLFVPLLLFVIARPIRPTTIAVQESRLSTPDLAAFLLAYLLPILAFDLATAPGVFALGFLLLVMAVVYTRGGLIHVQPCFFIFGWHVYECKKSSGEWCWIVTRGLILPGNVRARALGGHVLISPSETRADPE